MRHRGDRACARCRRRATRTRPTTFDFAGAVLAALALGGTTYALIEWGSAGAPWAGRRRRRRGGRLRRRSSGREKRADAAARRCSATAPSAPSNAMTFLVYAALGAVLFFLVIQLQTVGGYGALQAGLATLPITLCMLFLAARGGALGARIGPRIPMTVGPLVMAVGTLLVLGVDADVNYWIDVLPGPDRLRPRAGADGRAAHRDRAGRRPRRQRRHRQRRQQRRRPGRVAASRSRRCRSRSGLSGEEYADPVAFDAAYGSAMLACAALLALGGVVSWLTIPRRLPVRPGVTIRSLAGAGPGVGCLRWRPGGGNDDASTTPARRGGGRCALPRADHRLQPRRPGADSAGEPETSTSADDAVARRDDGGRRATTSRRPRSPTPTTPSTRRASAPARWSAPTCASTPRSR